jgi:uncharacterized coiled-coil DUF342 family protein
MSYATFEEMEMAVAEEFEEKINELNDEITDLKEERIDLLKEIDELKHDVAVAEEDADHWSMEYESVVDLIAWMRSNHSEILTTYEVTQRMED